MLSLLPVAVVLVTAFGPPFLMASRRRWRPLPVGLWVLAVGVLVAWTAASAALADSLPGGFNPEPLGERRWFAATLVASTGAVAATLRPGREPGLRP